MRVRADFQPEPDSKSEPWSGNTGAGLAGSLPVAAAYAARIAA